MVTLEEKNMAWEKYPEIRECAQSNDCTLCRENTPNTYCHLADTLLEEKT